MRLRVLGCHGGESPAHRATSFLIDERLLLDAGSTTRGLSVQEQLGVNHIFISHSHLDHVRDLGLLADNIFGLRKTPVEIYCSETTAKGLKECYFNNVLWPDFLTIPNPIDPDGNSMLRLNLFESGKEVDIGNYRLRAVTVDHSIECQSCFITDNSGGTLVYSGDTGPTEALWPEVNAVEDLRGFIFEVSFPNDMEQLANTAGHLTPKMMYAELEKFAPQNNDVPIFIYGLKPGYSDLLKEQIANLKDDRLRVLNPMDEFDL